MHSIDCDCLGLIPPMEANPSSPPGDEPCVPIPRTRLDVALSTLKWCFLNAANCPWLAP